MGKTKNQPKSNKEQPTNTEVDAVIEELADDDSAAESMTETEIERKYDQNQAQIFIQRNDFLIPNVLQMLKSREILDVAPVYQRRTRWNTKKQSRLIESLLMNVPIPPVFLYEQDLAKYEVMDGQQRLSTIRDFFNNKFKLRSLQKWPELNRRQFADLPPRIKAGLLRRGLSAVIILTESSQGEQKAVELRQYVFERLNTGGERLNAQEVRNCIYASPFNDMLLRIARSSVFTKVWDIPPKESKEPHDISAKLRRNRLYSTMADCEIVLRYFALSDVKAFRGGMKRTLDRIMLARKTLDKEECERLEAEYISILTLASNIFGDSLFRLPTKRGLEGRRSVPLADAVMLGLKNNVSKQTKLVKRKKELTSATLEALRDEESYESLTGRGNTKSEVEARINLMTKLIARIAAN